MVPHDRRPPTSLREAELWYLLDVIATRESVPGVAQNLDKAHAMETAMRFLETPTPVECRAMHAAGYSVVAGRP